MSGLPLRIAVVGHGNTGKTSLLRTLLRHRDFGEVKDESGTTNKVMKGKVADDAGVIAVLTDTPGIEDSERLRKEIESGPIDPRKDRRTLLDRFLASPVAAGCLRREAASVDAALNAHALLYVIDVREDPKPRHDDELFVLAATARPIVAVLNYTADHPTRSKRWLTVCRRQIVHNVLEFDAVVYNDEGEQRLLDAVNSLGTVRAYIPDLETAIKRWKALRERERSRAIGAATKVAAEFLITAAAAVVVTEPKKRKGNEREANVKETTDGFRKDLLDREAATRVRIAEKFGFAGDKAEAVALDVESVLGGIDFLSRANLLQHFGIVTSTVAGAAAGAGVGAMGDISSGGMSMGAGMVVGGAVGAAGAGGRKALRRLRGQEDLQVGEAVLEYLAARVVATIRAFLARGHAEEAPDRIEEAVENAVKENFAPGSDRAWRAPWRKARGKAAWSELSRPPRRRATGLARAKTVKKVADALEAVLEPGR